MINYGNFKEFFNKILKRYDYSISIDQAQQCLKNIDQTKFEEEVHYMLSSEILKSIKDKIVVTKKQHICPSQYQYQYQYPLDYLEYSTELFLCTKNEFYEIIRDFNRLNVDDQIQFEKFLAPSEEVYINQLRSDVLGNIFGEVDHYRSLVE